MPERKQRCVYLLQISRVYRTPINQHRNVNLPKRGTSIHEHVANVLSELACGALSTDRSHRIGVEALSSPWSTIVAGRCN